jgi:hypothetical protein
MRNWQKLTREYVPETRVVRPVDTLGSMRTTTTVPPVLVPMGVDPMVLRYTYGGEVLVPVPSYLKVAKMLAV